MKYTILFAALFTVFGLSACEKTTVNNPPPPATIVEVPVAVPGPAGADGNPGATGATGAPGEPGTDGAKGAPGNAGDSTILVVPVEK